MGQCVFIREVTVSLSDCFHGDRVWIEVHVCSGPLLACSGNWRKVVENGGNERGRGMREGGRERQGGKERERDR